jgi:hypothetical protein
VRRNREGEADRILFDGDLRSGDVGDVGERRARRQEGGADDAEDCTPRLA